MNARVRQAQPALYRWTKATRCGRRKCILRSHFLKLGAGFVRSGDVVPSTYYPNAAVSVAGATGTYWSKRVMFYMVFTDSDVLPNVSHHKYMGFSLRCLAIE